MLYQSSHDVHLPLKAHMQVLFDPPLPQEMRTLVKGKCQGVDARILLDSGAAKSHISKQNADTLRLPIHELPRALEVQGYDGRIQKLGKTCTVTVQVGEYGEDLPLLVTETSGSYDIILGQDWLSNHKCCLTFNPEDNTVATFRYDNKTYKIGED